jgi:hypothetical protein
VEPGKNCLGLPNLGSRRPFSNDNCCKQIALTTLASPISAPPLARARRAFVSSSLRKGRCGSFAVLSFHPGNVLGGSILREKLSTPLEGI